MAAARHPGVVELVGLEGSTERPVLVTVLVDGPTLAVPMPLTPAEVAGLMGSLATTVADLHDMGIVHGALVPEHVLVAPDGRPVLCGFGSAGGVGDGDEPQPSTDVAALGRLLRRLATGPDARALRRVAEAATADDPDARPSARDVAAELAAAVPDARLPVPPPAAVAGGLGTDPVRDLRSLVGGAQGGRGRRRPPQPAEPRPRSLLLGTDWDAAVVDGSDDDAEATMADASMSEVERPVLTPPVRHRGRRRTRVRPGAMVGAMVAVVAVGLILSAPWSSPAADPARPTPTAVPVPTTRPAAGSTTSSAAPSPTRPSARSDCPVPAAVLIADVDGDGCLDALRYADGVLEGAGARWAVGRDGDQVATGDWSCRGARTVVLLRPSTGEVFRFEGWAVGQEPVTAAMVATVSGGQAVRAADVDRDGCHELVVERGELPPQVVRLPRPAP